MFPISDMELAGLANLTNLNELGISACQISDEGLSFLPALTELRSLNIGSNGQRISNNCLDYVCNLVALEELRLSDNRQIDDAGLKQLKVLTKLRKLNLNGTLITDEGLVHLENMPELQELQMGGTRVTNAGLVHVQGLSKLQMLNVSGTRITKAGLESLKQLSQLSRIVK